VHRPDHADVVDVLGGVREDLADFQSALAVLLELEWRGERRTGLPLRAEVCRRQRLPRILRKRRLRVERIDLARPAVSEEVDDALRLRREVRLLRRKGIDRSGPLRVRGAQPGVAEQLREAEKAHADAGTSQQLAARQHRRMHAETPGQSTNANSLLKSNT